MVPDRYRVAVWDDEKVPGMDSGDGCKTVWAYLTPLKSG